MTAFYMWRLMNLTFYGKSRVAPEVAAHIHESPASMTVPLTLLAVGSVLAGWLGIPKLWNLRRELPRVRSAGWSRSSPRPPSKRRKEGEHGASTEWILMGLLGRPSRSSASWSRATSTITSPRFPSASSKSLKPLHGLLYNKWYVDEIYDFLFVNGLGKGGGRLLGAFDRNVVDGGVNGAGWLTRFSADGLDLVGHLDHRRRGAASARSS